MASSNGALRPHENLTAQPQCPAPSSSSRTSCRHVPMSLLQKGHVVVVPTTQNLARRLLKRAGQILSLLCRILPTRQFHNANTAAFRRLVNSGMDDAQSHFPSGSTYSWALWTGGISNLFDEIRHAAILTIVTWAIDSVARWSGNRIVD